MCSTQQSCRFSHDLTVCRVHCALFGHPRPSYKPRSSTHLPTCFREAWSSTTPTHTSFYLCTDPEQPAMMLVAQPCPRNYHISRASVHTHALPTPKPRRLTPLHLPSPAPSIFMRPPSRSPPSSLPSPDPTRLPSHPRAFRRAPLHPRTSIFHPQPRRLPSRSPPSSLPSPSGVLLRPTLRRTVSDGSPVWATCGVRCVAVPSFVGLAFGCIIYLEPE